MGNNASWYETGYEGAEEEAEKRSMGYPPDRLWQPAGNSKELVFIGDDPFCIKEHQWCDSNKNWHHATCLAKIEDSCPACSQNGVSRPDYVGHYTIVDITGYTTKDGTENKNRLILLPAKTKVLNKFRMKKENKGSLLGQLWSLTRSDSNSPNTGDDLDNIREVNMDGLYTVVTYKGKLLKDIIDKANGNGQEAERTRKFMAHHFQIPAEGPIPEAIPQFNFPTLMAPLSIADMKTKCADAVPFKSNKPAASSSSSSSPEEVPF